MFKKSPGMTPNTQRWAGIVRQLAEYMERFQLQQELLRDIDRSIIRERGAGGAALQRRVAEQLPLLLPMAGASVYLFSGTWAEAERTAHSAGAAHHPPVIKRGVFERCFSPWLEGTGLWSAHDDAPCPLGFRGATALAVPLEHEGDQLGMLVVEADQHVSYTPYAEPDACRFLSTLAGQLAVERIFAEQVKSEGKLWNLASALFTGETDPLHCLDPVARYLRTPPDGAPRALQAEDIQVQILFLENFGERPVLTIRGSTSPDENPGLTQVDIDESVCGLLIKDESLPHLMCDPRQEPYRSLYKNYLGGRGQRQIKSELAIPLEEDGPGQEGASRRFAVINFESRRKNAFTDNVIPLYKRLAKGPQPLLLALKGRIEENALAQHSTLQALESYLALVGMQFQHSQRTPLATISLGIDFIKLTPNLDRRRLDEALVQMEQAMRSVQAQQAAFSKDLSRFASPAPYDVGQLIADSVRVLSAQHMDGDGGPAFELDLAPGLVVECSLFLKQVFHNILQNSLTWLGHKRRDKPGHQGRISVSLARATEPPQGQERNLNRFCRIVFEDNGPGCRPELLPSLTDKSVSHRQGGTGFGLYAASQYVRGLGGTLKPDSREGESFTVTIHLRLASGQAQPPREAT